MLNRFDGPGFLKGGPRFLYMGPDWLKNTYVSVGLPVNKMLVNCVEISCENLNRFWGIFWIFKECSELAEMFENKGIWGILLNRFYPYGYIGISGIFLA